MRKVDCLKMCHKKIFNRGSNKVYMTKLNWEMKLSVRKVSQEIWNKTLSHKKLKGREEINLYEKVLVSDINTLDKNKSQMEQWSILSDNIVYVRSVGYDDMSGVDIKMVHYCNNRKMCKKWERKKGK